MARLTPSRRRSPITDRRRTRSRLVAAGLLACALAACSSSGKGTSPSTTVPGSSSPPPTQGSAPAPPAILGRTFLSTSVTGFALPKSTRITLTFESNGQLSANAGCNTMTGRYHITGNRLVVDPLAITQMGCLPAHRQAADSWLAGVLGAQPDLTMSGSNMRLSDGKSTIDLSES